RFFVTYHYVEADDYRELGFSSADDPRFQDLISRGAANIYLRDLLTGVTKRLTNMGPGHFAMFPHFRSDGWIYFMVYDAEGANARYAVASDAALRMLID